MTTKQQPHTQPKPEGRPHMQHPCLTVAILEKFKDARVHYAVLKQRTNPPSTP
jgi:hypothetical protein